MQEPPPSAVRKFAPHPKSFAAVGSVLPDAPLRCGSITHGHKIAECPTAVKTERRGLYSMV